MCLPAQCDSHMLVNQLIEEIIFFLNVSSLQQINKQSLMGALFNCNLLKDLKQFKTNMLQCIIL